MSHQEEALRDNPYFVRAGSELGAMDGMFSVPKMFSKSAIKPPAQAKAPAQAAPAPAKAPANRFSMFKMFSKPSDPSSASKSSGPASKSRGMLANMIRKTPNKAIPRPPLPTFTGTPPEYCDLYGNVLSAESDLIVPKMLYNADYNKPRTASELEQEKDSDPDKLYKKMIKKYKLNDNRFFAEPCDWLHKGQPVYTCLVLNANRLLICLFSGNLREMFDSWVPFAITDYITRKPIHETLRLSLSNKKDLWFSRL